MIKFYFFLFLLHLFFHPCISGLYPDLLTAISNCSHPRFVSTCLILKDESWKDNFEVEAKVYTNKYATEIMSSFPQAKADDIYVYLHSHFPSKKVYGFAILDKILEKIRTSGLFAKLTRLIIIGYNIPVDAVYLLDQFNDIRKVYYANQTHQMSNYFEFPSLSILQYHAKHFHHPEAKLLYLHLKGVTQFQDNVRSYVRESMLYFSVVLHQQSLSLLEKGWDTSGISYLGTPYFHYSGNFFWIRAESAAKNPNISDYFWHWRFGAEQWPLSSIQGCRAFRPPFDNHQLWINFISGKKPEDSHSLFLASNISSPQC